MILKFDGSSWMGKFDTSMDNITGHAELAVFGHKLFMRDRFIDSKGKIIWGADEIYKFNRINT